MKVVIDVNVWLSGLLWGGLPAQVLRLDQQGTIVSYVSPELLLELETTLRRPKFQPQLSKRQQTIENLCDVVRAISTALGAKAQFLISGDLDLLVLNPFQTIQIVTPSDFLQSLEG